MLFSVGMTLTVEDPRIERTRTVVLAAAVDVIAESGFAGATIDAIARRSGVARSTIYRNWPDRQSLLMAAVRSRIGDIESLATGDLRSDLITIGWHLAQLLASEPMGSVVASLILESRHDEQLEALRQDFVASRWAAMGAIVQDAVDRGDLPAGSDASSIAEELAAPIFFHALILREPVDRAWVAVHVDGWLQDRQTRSYGHAQ